MKKLSIDPHFKSSHSEYRDLHIRFGLYNGFLNGFVKKEACFQIQGSK